MALLRISKPSLPYRAEMPLVRRRATGYGDPRRLTCHRSRLPVLATLAHIIARKGSIRVVVRLRALLRSNEFYLVPLALAIGIITGAIVTLISQIAQIAHMLIYGIPIDVRLSSKDWVNPAIALLAPACGGLALGVMEWLRRRWKLAAAVDPVEANALRGGRLSLRDSIVVGWQTLVSNGSGSSVGL